MPASLEAVFLKKTFVPLLAYQVIAHQAEVDVIYRELYVIKRRIWNKRCGYRGTITLPISVP
jgi:hypothetical protein